MSKLPDLSAIDITPILPEGTNIIKSYSDNSITINDKKFDYNIIASEFDIIKFTSFDDIDHLNIDENTIIIFGSKNTQARSDFYNFMSKKCRNSITFENQDDGKENDCPAPQRTASYVRRGDQEVRHRQGLITGGYMFEIMDLGAACRTFNVLIQESRKVVGIFDVQGS